MKPIAGYAGSNEVLKRLIAWDLLELTLQIKMKSKINRHKYMKHRRREHAAS